MLCLHCLVAFFLVAVSGSYSFVEVHQLLIVVASFLTEHRL